MVKILVVEDEEYARISLVQQLKNIPFDEECQILEAENGRRGLSLAKKERPELIFTDIKMPFTDGIELLKEVKCCLEDTTVIMVSAYAEFHYAQEAIKLGASGYLLKPVIDEELADIITRFHKASEYRSSWLEEYIGNGVLNQEVGDTDFENTEKFEKLFREYNLISIYFRDGKVPLKSNLKKLLRQGMKKQELELPVVEVGKKHWCVVCDSLECESFVQRIAFLLSREGYRYKAGVSLSYRDGRKLQKAYQESVLAVKSKIFYEEKRNIIFYRDLEERTAACEDIGEKPLNSIQLYMEQGNETLACSRLESWIRDIFSIPKLKISSIEGVLIQIFAMVHLLIEKYTLNPEEKYHIPISFSILDVDSVDELIKRMNRLIQILCMEMKKEKESNPDKLVRVMTEYIHQNYNKEISLKDLAENVLFMNHTYLSHIFAEKTGSCYSAYLKQVRMEKAKEFLKKDTLSITDVAISSGYNDCSQFIRSFKKEVGMTPKKFRERHKT